MAKLLDFLDKLSERRTLVRLTEIRLRPQTTGFSSREQLMAFCLLVLAAAIVGLAPVIVTGLMGKIMPDALIANSDKTVTGFIGVLGTITGLIFRRSQADDAATSNNTKALDAIRSAQTTPADGGAGRAADSVADAASDRADEIKGDAP